MGLLNKVKSLKELMNVIYEQYDIKKRDGRLIHGRLPRLRMIYGIIDGLSFRWQKNPVVQEELKHFHYKVMKGETAWLNTEQFSVDNNLSRVWQIFVHHPRHWYRHLIYIYGERWIEQHEQHIMFRIADAISPYPMIINPEWIKIYDYAPKKLAHWEDRAIGQLADLFEEVGANLEILDHLRNEYHGNLCWVCDEILKEEIRLHAAGKKHFTKAQLNELFRK